MMDGRLTPEQFETIQVRLCDRNPYGLWGTQALRDLTTLVAEVLLLRAEIEELKAIRPEANR